MTIPYQDITTPVQDTIVELFQLDLRSIGVNQVYYFCNEAVTTSISFQGYTYQAVPIEATGFSMSSNSGDRVTPTLKVANVLSAITVLVLSYQDLRGAKLIRKRTHAKYLDGMPTANPLMEYEPDIFYIERKASENSLEVVFELMSSIEYGLKAKIPKRLVLPNQCQWRYRSAECSYTGPPVADINDHPTNSLAFDECGLRVKSCKMRFGENAELPYGAFEGVDSYQA